MNWAALAVGVGLAAAASVILAARRGAGSRAGKWLAVPLLIVVCLNGAAPFRGLIDSSYMGYVFGALAADRGWQVTFVAGSVLVAALVAAHIAVRRRHGPALWIVAATCGALAVNLAAPSILQLIRDPSAGVIELGEYATIPAFASTIIILGVLSLPFAVGAIWAARAARRT